MKKSITDTYPELWHYTTGIGLHGILTTQTLWATNIFYLNDAEEFSGFFDRKLERLLEEGIEKGMALARESAHGPAAIQEEEIQRKVKFARYMLPALRKATLDLSVYVTSFCFTPNMPGSEDGLLSQWRGYGQDGGYAIVFDTQGLHELINEESKKYLYSFTHWGDVDYFHGESVANEKHEETLEWENDIRELIAAGFEKNKLLEIGEALFVPIISLATRHKHRGFQEEREVRISLVLLNEADRSAAQKLGDKRAIKKIQFLPRSGILIPYIGLFERNEGAQAKLPIKTIIVGPHPDKDKRKKAVEIMLRELKIDAKVVCSDIPYLGR